jgi:hypothetical protein
MLHRGLHIHCKWELDDPQQVMTRATGDYKRGNERRARKHSHNR